MVTILIIILTLMVAAFAILKIGDSFSPWMITTGIWLAILFIAQIDNSLIYPLSDQFYTSLILWIPSLVIPAIATYYALPEHSNPNILADRHVDIHQGFFMLFFTISIVFTPIYLYNIYKIIVMFGTEDLFTNLRMLANSEEDYGNSGLLKYINTVNKALFIIALWRYPLIGKWKMTLIIMANIMCAIAIMEKSFMFFLFFTTLFILYAKRKVKLKTIFLSCFAIIFVFYGVNILRSNVESDDYDTISEFITMYIISPAVAFGKVQEKLTDQFGTRSLTFFYSFINKAGLGNFEVDPKLQEFVWVPIPVNVYTVFQPFFEDFGYKGVAFFGSVYGFFTGWLYRQCKNGGFISRCLYAYLIYVLVLQFFQENLIISLSWLFQYLIIFTLVLQQRVGIRFHFGKT